VGLGQGGALSIGREWVGSKSRTTTGKENTRKRQFIYLFLIVFYLPIEQVGCQSGKRSKDAAAALADAGLSVLEVEGGYSSWARATPQLPVTAGSD
jgi:hypothetical protein